MMQTYQSNAQPRQAQFYGAPIRQQLGNQLQAIAQPKRVAVKLTQGEKGDATFYIENVENAHNIEINAPGLKYQVTRSTGTNNYKVKYFPTGGEHTVEVKYDGAHVDGSPFFLAPTPPKMTFNHEEGTFSVENVHDVEKLQIKSDTLPYEMFRDNELSTKYHVKYEIGQQIHDVAVVYNDTPVEGGSFRLVPKGMKETYMRDQEQEKLANKFDQLDTGGDEGELLWEHTPETVHAQPPIREQPVIMANSEQKGELLFEHIPEQNIGNSVRGQTLYQPPPQARIDTFY